MQKGYFAASWGDIINSPGWFSKFLKLGLLCFIPVFGVIVAFGYLYGWAREIAWNIHRPMGERIFANEDGTLYKRGLYIFVISFVFSLAPTFFSFLSNFITGVSIGVGVSLSSIGGSLFLVILTTLVGIVLSLLVEFFVYVGSMRTSIYTTLSSGFQLGKIWAMIRYDFTGLLRILAMSIVVGLVVSAIIGIIAVVLVLLGVFAATLVHGSEAIIAVMFLGILFVVFGCLVFFFLWMFQEALVARALGYWMRQFEVSSWGGQEDLMPFEKQYCVPQVQYYQPYQDVSFQQGGSVNEATYSVQQSQPVPVQNEAHFQPQGGTEYTAPCSNVVNHPEASSQASQQSSSGNLPSNDSSDVSK